MHMLIRVIVEANNKEDAIWKAKKTLDKLSGDGKPFDYYSTFDEDRGLGSGNNRWGNLPSAVKVNSKAGKKLIDEGMEAIKNEFFSNLKDVREALLCFTDEEIFEQCISDDRTKMLMALTEDRKRLESQFYLVKHKMHCCGKYQGPSVWLYDKDGAGLRNKNELKHYLDEIKKSRAWVVPADVHY